MSDLIEVLSNEFVLVEEQVVSTIDILDEGIVSITEESLTLVSEAIQGPQGIQGIQGPPGALLIFSYSASIAISGHRIVSLNGLGEVEYASSGNITQANRIVGMTMNAAVPGGLVSVQKFGELTEPSWNWTLSQPIYLSIDGALTQTPPSTPASQFSVIVGFPISPTAIFVNIGNPIILTS